MSATAPPPADREAIARGFLLICVFYVHSLYGVFSALGSNPDTAMLAGAQIKLLAPNVSIFFLLSGMAARHFHRKGWLAVFKPSLTLLVLAALSHVVAVVLDMALRQHWYGTIWFLRRLFKPIAFGTGYENFVAWFFVVLAFARIFAFAFKRSWRVFALAGVIGAGAVLASRAADLPDNIYEWRNWPTATLFFLVGMRIPTSWRLTARWGLPALMASLTLAWINRPGLWRDLACLNCDLGFVAQPMVGQYGSLPVYVAQQLLFVTFLLWVSHWAAGKMPGKVAAYFGSDSLSMLLMHGWILVTLYPLAARSLPPQESVFLYLSILSLGLVAHAALFFCLHPLLRAFSLLAFRVSARIADFLAWLVRHVRRSRPSSETGAFR